MARRRVQAVLSATALAAGLVVATGGGATATQAPTRAQLDVAQRRVVQAQQGLSGVQQQAERAAEDYNGAQVRAAAAQSASQQAAAAAETARVQAQQAQATSVAAGTAAELAAAQANQARTDHDAAVARVAAAQHALDAFAAGAYRSGGILALVSAMLEADPMTWATGRKMVDRVDAHQRDAVVTLSTARSAAGFAAVLAGNAEDRAADQARQVAVLAAQADQSAAAARSSAAAAASAASDATAAAGQAAAAKERALVLVAAAERDLGAASADAAGLAAKAEQARREAEAVQHQQPGVDAPPAGGAAATAIAWAYREIGVPYAWGGGTASGPSRGFAQGAGTIGFDCSGLTLFAYAHAGIRLDHYTGSQWQAGRHVTRAQLAPGDLMFFADDITDASTIHHVAIYLGGDRMIESPHTGDVVRVSSTVRRDFIGGVRLTS